MELTPKVFRDVQFREKLRGGYHPEDVDEFLEQAAVAAESLLEQLRQATERAQRAEQVAADASGTDETLKRMLLMAQRTADQAVREAKEEADRVLAEARSQAQSILADAEARGRASYEAAVNERRSTMEAADAALKQAEQEVEALRGWVDLHRNHLLGIMRDAEALIENAGLVSEPPTATPLPPIWSSGRAEPGNGAGLVAERDALGHREGDSGDWDPRYLDDVSEEAPTGGSPAAGPGPGWSAPQGAHAAPPFGAEGLSGPAGAGQGPGGMQTSGGVQAGGGRSAGAFQAGGAQSYSAQAGPPQAGLGSPPWRPLGTAANGGAVGEQTLVSDPEPAPELIVGPISLDDAPTGEHRSVTAPPEGDSTLAFDERALDNFFSEQDLGDERGGLGRFRRRQ